MDDSGNNFITCKKNTLHNIVIKNNDFMKTLIDAVERTNKIVTLTYLFIKSYLIHFLDKKNRSSLKYQTFPDVNIQFVRNVINTITIKTQNRGSKGLNNQQVKDIQKFYNEHFKPIIDKNNMIVSRDKLKAVLNYEEIDIVKNISTNIAKNFISHLRFFIKVYYSFDRNINDIKNSKIDGHKKSAKLKKIYDTWNGIITDIINVTGNKYVSEKKYHKDIAKFKSLFIPAKKSYAKKSVLYDVKAKPLDYVYQMINIDIELELLNQKIIKNHKDKKTNPPIYGLFNALPLRKDVVPKYITLDTTSLIDLFIKEGSKEYRDSPSDFREILWDRFFKTNTRSFKKNGYNFNYMIKTDGIASSILFVRLGQNGKPVKMSRKFTDNEVNISVPYIEEIKITNSIKKKKIVVDDPGKNDLANFMKLDSNGNPVYMKYTQRQRDHYTKKKKYNEIRKKLEKESCNKNGLKVKDLEAQLANYNSKSCIFNVFLKYLREKIKINSILFDHYNKEIYRKLKWYTYINQNRNEDMMLNKFEEKMGSPKNTIVVFGDWVDKGLKGKPPTISKKIIKIFKKRGYECYMIDEYKTSKLCSHCHKPTSNLVVNEKKLWKLIKCKTCGSIHNRDHNATKNMMNIAKQILKKKGRPKKFIRPKTKKI